MPRFLLAATCIAAALPTSSSAQKPDYYRADVIRTAASYVFGTSVFPRFLEDSVRFWFTSTNKQDRGVTYVVDPVRATRRALFDNARLAAALSIVADTLIEPTRLPRFTVVDTGKTVEVQMRKKVYRCNASTYGCDVQDTIVWRTEQRLKTGPDWAMRSPDKKWDVFLYNYNLYVRPAELSDQEAIATRDSVLRAATPVVANNSNGGTTTKASADTAKKDSAAARPARSNPDSVAIPKGSIQLTTDGAENWAYDSDQSALFGSTTMASRWKPKRAFVGWSPDSRRVGVQRLDYRNLRRYPLYSSTGTQPADKSYFYATPGDTVIPKFDVYTVDVVDKTTTRVDQPSSPAVNFGAGTAWARSADRMYVMSASRGYKRMTLSAVDTKTGKATVITRDSFPSWVESRGFRVVNGGEDIFYISERDGWSHIYRFSSEGKLKNQVESGPYAVTGIVRVDSVAKQLYFNALGKEAGNPYYAHLYRVNFDGSGLTLLNPEQGSHSVSFIPKANYFIDTYAPADKPPTVVLRSGETGRVVMELAKGDVELLASVRWTPPEVFNVKARDGVTDLWGLMYKPSDFDSTRSYPIIDNIYPGPQVGSVGGWSFNARHEPRALAELGFIVIQLDHMGTPGRSKAFHDYYFGNMGDNGIPDHVAGITQLAARHRWIDINRVAIYGHSGGGFASTDAIFRYPDFFKVAVSTAGNHDNRTYGFFWGEKYQGLLTKDARTGKDNFEASANYTLAGNLKGKLLLMHGDMDNNVHPANTLRVVDALIKANKMFDMVIIPDAAHGLPAYATRRTWDYFVQHLLGLQPPDNYKMMDRLPSTVFF
ncbi:MAG: DPP IV N-terminal domain-containing protein [Longimicrobiales bacterium]